MYLQGIYKTFTRVYKKIKIYRVFTRHLQDIYRYLQEYFQGIYKTFTDFYLDILLVVNIKTS